MQNKYIEIFMEIMNLKKQKRSGWIIDGRGLDYREVESVSDHSWAASIIALLFLPEKTEVLFDAKKGLYDKNRIIRMLIIHDLAESYIGDIPFGSKTILDREREQQRFLYYASLNDNNVSCLAEVNELWCEYEALETLNSQIAKDIDQIEGYIQLYIYKEKLIMQNGLENWNKLVNDWSNNITIRTSWGEQLLCIVKETF